MVRIECVALEKRLKDKEREFHLKVPFFSVSSGERKAIIGATGSGKTTVMDILAMVSVPDACSVFRLSEATGSIDLLRALRSRRTLARLRADVFGYVMQKSPLFPFLTVAENVELQQQISRRRDRRYTDTIMGMLGVASLARALPAELSVGQKQRTAIARSLSHRPSIILCDEPTGSLDPVTARQSMETILWAAETTNAAVVMITHDWKLAGQFGFSFHVMQTESRKGNVTVSVLQPLDDVTVEREI